VGRADRSGVLEPWGVVGSGQRVVLIRNLIEHPGHERGHLLTGDIVAGPKDGFAIGELALRDAVDPHAVDGSRVGVAGRHVSEPVGVLRRPWARVVDPTIEGHRRRMGTDGSRHQSHHRACRDGRQPPSSPLCLGYRIHLWTSASMNFHHRQARHSFVERGTAPTE